MENDRITSTLKSWAYWRFQLFAWGFLGGYMLLLNVFFWKWTPVLVEVAKIAVFTLASHLIATVALSKKWFRLERSGIFLRGLAACLIAGLVVTAIFHPPMKMGGKGKTESFKAFACFFFWEYLRNAAILTMWGSFYLAFCFRELGSRAEMDRMRLAASSRDLQLSTLRNQLNPHFLFNSFNLLRALVQSDPATARDAITHLAEMMRHSLSSANYNTISLGRELEFLDSYIALEKLRYEERLRIFAKVPGDLHHRTIPSMLLYTLVENAVKYGIDQSRQGVDVSYEIWPEPRRLWLLVINDGKLATESKSAGTGLANLRQRLHLLYGEEATLEVFQGDGRVIARACWPSETHEEEVR